MTTPRHPCPYCGSMSFAWIERASVELCSDAKVGFGNVLNPTVSLMVCEGCGHTAWFMREPATMLEGIKHERRSVPVTGYR
ncbi:MAG: hypothetical protein R3A52_11665 [Polyangiales bacterium]